MAKEHSAAENKTFMSKYLHLSLGTIALVLFLTFLGIPTRVKEDSCFVFLDRTGKVVSERFEAAMPFSEGLAAVKKDSLWGYIDKSGKWVIGPKFSSADPFHEGFASVRVHGKATFIDKHGNFLTTKRFSRALGFENGLAIVVLDTPKGERFGCLDTAGNYQIPPNFARADLLVQKKKSPDSLVPNNVQSLHLITKNGKRGYVDRFGNLVVKPLYADAEEFSEGLAAVKAESGLYGFIDEKGVMKISPQFELAFPFSGGLAVVGEVTDSWDENDRQPVKKLGIIDKKGSFVVPKILRSATSFSEGYLLVQPMDCNAFNYREER